MRERADVNGVCWGFSPLPTVSVPLSRKGTQQMPPGYAPKAGKECLARPRSGARLLRTWALVSLALGQRHEYSSKRKVNKHPKLQMP